MRRLLAATLCVMLATTASPLAAVLPPAEDVRGLPVGTKIRIEQTDGTVLSGKIEEVTSDAIVMQTKGGKVLVEVPFIQISRLTVAKGSAWTPWAIGKTIGKGVWSGVGAIVKPFVLVAVLIAVFHE
jgi:hypothetical protein